MKSAKSDKKTLKYEVNQKVVYPLQGVGKITAIKKRLFQGKKILYYIIYIEVTDMTIMVPVEQADYLGIRPIVKKRMAKKALETVSKNISPITADWKMRYQMNLDLLKKGTVLNIAKIVRTLYNRSKVKELPILERKLFDNAFKLLVDEISSSLNKEKEEIEDLIFKKMEMN